LDKQNSNGPIAFAEKRKLKSTHAKCTHQIILAGTFIFTELYLSGRKNSVSLLDWQPTFNMAGTALATHFWRLQKNATFDNIKMIVSMKPPCNDMLKKF
jgi:hypothetical protein